MNAQVNLNRKRLETKVQEFLAKYAKDQYAKEEMAAHIARVSLMMNHLYQDLGFKNRFEMGIFMKRHFPELSNKKPKDKLWKKFIYDSIGETAPACAQCADQVSCFKGTCLPQ
jgi:nitrogen fixation protein NifQ